MLNKNGIINPESNYCFGEGGAGTYSDGKLYTRSTKRGNIDRILNLFVHFGADENILYEAHPHIGTNKLPVIITEMRKRITGCGGEFHFSKKVADFEIENSSVEGVRTEDGDLFKGDAFILATGHSARDIFILLDKKNIAINAKPFALGVRIEHPQALINNIQYGSLQFRPAGQAATQESSAKGKLFKIYTCPRPPIASLTRLITAAYFLFACVPGVLSPLPQRIWESL